jgi:xanthine dehydrogenase molybdopterin-binding subunit B
MESDDFCIFCHSNTEDLIEINSNAIEVNYSIIEFNEIVKELYDKKVKSLILNYFKTSPKKKFNFRLQTNVQH